MFAFLNVSMSHDQNYLIETYFIYLWCTVCNDHFFILRSWRRRVRTWTPRFNRCPTQSPSSLIPCWATHLDDWHSAPWRCPCLLFTTALISCFLPVPMKILLPVSITFKTCLTWAFYKLYGAIWIRFEERRRSTGAFWEDCVVRSSQLRRSFQSSAPPFSSSQPSPPRNESQRPHHSWNSGWLVWMGTFPFAFLSSGYLTLIVLF